MAREIRRFQVALKALVVRDGRLLALRERGGPGYWEFPGGRIEVGEEQVPQVDVLRRELVEELGPAFRCTIGAPLVTWTRPMLMYPGEWGMLVGFLCTDAAGEIALSDEHSDLRWVDRESWRALEFAPGYDTALRAFWERA
jgi:8-oxo-dGTP diphosphatase